MTCTICSQTIFVITLFDSGTTAAHQRPESIRRFQFANSVRSLTSDFPKFDDENFHQTICAPIKFGIKGQNVKTYILTREIQSSLLNYDNKDLIPLSQLNIKFPKK